MGLFKKPEAEPTYVDGKPLHCLVCEGDRFWRRRSQLNTALATFFSFDWANRSATCVVCADCGYIHWFMVD